MMGGGGDDGIIPRLCKNIFDRIDKQTTSQKTYTVEVSYYEIYQEEVMDLLSSNKRAKHELKVRCAVFDRNLHSMMPLVPTPARLKLLHAYNQWHSSRVSTTSYRLALHIACTH
jgi:hypothetical protein